MNAGLEKDKAALRVTKDRAKCGRSLSGHDSRFPEDPSEHLATGDGLPIDSGNPSLGSQIGPEHLPS